MKQLIQILIASSNQLNLTFDLVRLDSNFSLSELETTLGWNDLTFNLTVRSNPFFL